ncbi:MAG: efflux RND transporter periplasmic adaptor subunit [Myxococcota bacterium]
MTRMRKTTLWACLLAFAWLACGNDDVAETSPVRPVVVTRVLVRDLEERIEASGQLLAKHEADVAAQVAGEITEVLVDEGDAIAEGAVVMEIDPEKRNLELEAARAGVGEARAAVAEETRELKRMRILAEKKVASETQLDQAGTALDTARARLRAAKAQLGTAERAVSDASVRARFAGFIARRFVSRGEFVSQGDPLFQLVSLDPIEVEFHLPEADSSRVRKGIPIEVTVAPYPDEIFEAIAHMVSPTIDPRTRTLRVKALIDNSDGRLRPGLFARANLGIAHRNGVITVPEEAVLQRLGGPVIFRVLDGNRVERIAVEIGVIRDGWVEIREGLGPRDRVVSRGHSDLIDGSPIIARNRDGTLAVATGAPVASVPAGAIE